MRITSLASIAAAVAVLSVFAFNPAPSHADALEEGRAAIAEEDYGKALRLLMPLAEQGNPVAQNAIGVLYQNGWGLEQDHGEAIGWFRKAARQGEPKSHFNLGTMYEKGWGVTRDCGEAERWYLAPAKRGNPVGQVKLGDMYYEGGDCIEKDFVEAVKWYRKAAEQGDPVGQTSLGRMYFGGEGVKQDFAEAMKWYRQAAALGLAEAQFYLGMMFEFGLGVAQDKTEALSWYRLAAEQGHPPAMPRVEALAPSAVPRSLPPEARWVPSLETVLAAPAAVLAEALHLTKQTIGLLPLVEKGVALHTGLIPGVAIDRNNLDAARSVLESRRAVYETAVARRGYKSISGAYRAKATSSCRRAGSAWAGSIGGGEIRDLEIKQDGFSIELVHRPALPFKVTGVVVESALAFTDPMNSDYVFIGKIKADKLKIRPDVDSILAAWPGWASPPSRKDLRKCKVTLVPRK